MGDNAGAFLGPVLTVFLLYALHIGIRSIFYLAVIPGLVAFLMVLMVTERRTTVSSKSKIDIGLWRFPNGYRKYLLATALFGLGNSSNSFLILRTQDIGLSLEWTILIYAAFNLVAALISYPAGLLSDQWGRRNVLVGSLVIFFISYHGFALIENIGLIAVLFIVYGLYQGIFRAVGKAFASDFVPDELRASGVGWYSTAVGLLVCSGTEWVMSPCSIMVRSLRSSAASACCCWFPCAVLILDGNACRVHSPDLRRRTEQECCL